MPPLMIIITTNYAKLHFVKSVRIRSYSSPYLPGFGLNTKRYSASFRLPSSSQVQEITNQTDNFYSVLVLPLKVVLLQICEKSFVILVIVVNCT